MKSGGEQSDPEGGWMGAHDAQTSRPVAGYRAPPAIARARIVDFITRMG
jgi:hypothetical protein